MIMMSPAFAVVFSIIFDCSFTQPPSFNPHDFVLDGFEVSRGYFSSLQDKESCATLNSGNCMYSNFINSPNVLFLPTSPSSTAFTSTFALDANEAIVVGGFAPPLAAVFSITPYAAFTNGSETFAPISNHSLLFDSTFFVAVISGDLHTFELIQEWFQAANTTLTTAIYNHHLHFLPIVQQNENLNINENTEYAVILRHETLQSSQYDLKYVFSQAPTLGAWKVKALNYSDAKSKMTTNLVHTRAATNDEWDISLSDITPSNGSSLTLIGQDEFELVGDNSTRCLVGASNCYFVQPETVVFESTVFQTENNSAIYVSGINHINTGNAVYFTLNIVDSEDRSILAQTTFALDDTSADANYVLVFAEDCGEMATYECEAVSIRDYEGIKVVEIVWNEVALNAEHLQPPNVVISSEEGGDASDGSGGATEEPEEATGGGTSPNILFVFMDDLGWRDVGYNGAEFATPNIDALAASGLILNQFYVHPVCTPTRTALFTGRYAFRYNLTIPLDVGQRRYLPYDVDTLPEVLSAHGYSTHLVGKWHAGGAYWDNFPFGRGFDTFYGINGGFADFYSHQQCWDAWDGFPYPHLSGDNLLRLLNAFFPDIFCTYDLYDGKALDFNEDYLPTLFADRAIDIISSKHPNTSDPFFMFYSMGTPHTPLVQPPRVYSECNISQETYGTNRYDYCNMILEGDRQIGRVVDALKEQHLWENTIVIFSADNGAVANVIPGNIILGSAGSNLPLRGQKSSPFDGGNRVVAFLNGGYMEEYIANLDESISNKLYHVADWYDTIIYGMAGIEFEDASAKDSFNIWESLINSTVASPRKEWVWSVNFGASPTAIRQNDWKLVLNPQSELDGYWDVNNVTLALGQAEGESVYLFNATADEIESVNLKDVHPDVVQDLQDRLEEVEEDGFTASSDDSEVEGMIIAILSGTSIPFLELTQGITINTTEITVAVVEDGSDDDGLVTGLIVGGVVLGVLVVGCCLFIFWRRRKLEYEMVDTKEAI